MKRLLLAAALMCLIPMGSLFAQGSAASMPQVKLGNLPFATTTSSGKPVPITATKEEILANTTLTVQAPSGCEVTSFSFSFLPEGKDILGPYEIKGASLGLDIVNAIKSINNPRDKMYIDNIKVKCGNARMTGAPIVLNVAVSATR